MARGVGGADARRSVVCPVATSPTAREVERAAAAVLALDPERPPIASTSRVEMLRPRPVPPYFRVVEPSACLKGSKMCACWSAGMPMPVSCTSKCKQ